MPRPSVAICVDDRLLWVLRLAEQGLGTARPSSPEALRELTGALEEPRPAELIERMVDAAARIVAAVLADLPELPYIGEPFGGEDGTD